MNVGQILGLIADVFSIGVGVFLIAMVVGINEKLKRVLREISAHEPDRQRSRRD